MPAIFASPSSASPIPGPSEWSSTVYRQGILWIWTRCRLLWPGVPRRKIPWAPLVRRPTPSKFSPGVVNGRLCGAPLALEIRNRDAHSADYAPLEHRPRPGHADYTARLRYGGYEDKSGGGHFSGRLTAPLCAAGGIILQLLREQGVEIAGQALEIGGIRGRAFDPMAPEIHQIPAGPLPALEKGEAMAEAIQAARSQGDSLGGVIECAAVGFPAGIGDPMFDGLENRIARCVFAVPAVKGLEFGAGFDVARLRGSENNDPFCCGKRPGFRPQPTTPEVFWGAYPRGCPSCSARQ